MGHGWVRVKAFSPLLPCACLELSMTFRPALLFIGSKKNPPRPVLSSVSRSNCGMQTRGKKNQVLVECRNMNGREVCDLTQYISVTFSLSETLSMSCRVSEQLMPVEVLAETASNPSVLFRSLTRQKMGTSSTR